MLHYTITEAKAKFAELFEKAFAGEEIIVTKMGHKAIKMGPMIEKKSTANRIGFLKGKFYIAEDFDELPDDIARAFGMID